MRSCAELQEVSAISVTNEIWKPVSSSAVAADKSRLRCCVSIGRGVVSVSKCMQMSLSSIFELNEINSRAVFFNNKVFDLRQINYFWPRQINEVVHASE